MAFLGPLQGAQWSNMVGELKEVLALQQNTNLEKIPKTLQKMGHRTGIGNRLLFTPRNPRARVIPDSDPGMWSPPYGVP